MTATIEEVQAPPHWSDEFAAKLSGQNPTGVVKIHSFQHGEVKIEFDGHNDADLQLVQQIVAQAATMGMTSFALFTPQRRAEVQADSAIQETGEDRMLQRGDSVPAEASEVQVTPRTQGG
jgi:hypothetical protein